jgi:hypothetical protein
MVFFERIANAVEQAIYIPVSANLVALPATLMRITLLFPKKTGWS